MNQNHRHTLTLATCFCIILTATLLPARSVYAAAPTCNGLTATHWVEIWPSSAGGDDKPYIYTTSQSTGNGTGDEYSGSLDGTNGADVIVAPPKAIYADSNTIDGGNGDDTICGSIDNDTGDILKGNNGKDYIIGSPGPDEIYGSNQDDILIGGDGNDYIDGDNGKDTITGGDGSDEIYSGNGNDIVYADGLDSVVDGGNANDQCFDSNITENCEVSSPLAVTLSQQSISQPDQTPTTMILAGILLLITGGALVGRRLKQEQM